MNDILVDRESKTPRRSVEEFHDGSEKSNSSQSQNRIRQIDSSNERVQKVQSGDVI